VRFAIEQEAHAVIIHVLAALGPGLPLRGDPAPAPTSWTVSGSPSYTLT
jgi:hypothetical protein